jgi:hypothetical protein
VAYKDGGIFTTYCDKSYNQNSYELFLLDGSSHLFDDYTEMRNFWWQHMKSGRLSHVIIVDKVQIKGVAKGF